VPHGDNRFAGHGRSIEQGWGAGKRGDGFQGDRQGDGRR
jgi:hypothetical protein